MQFFFGQLDNKYFTISLYIFALLWGVRKDAKESFIQTLDNMDMQLSRKSHSKEAWILLFWTEWASQVVEMDP